MKTRKKKKQEAEEIEPVTAEDAPVVGVAETVEDSADLEVGTSGVEAELGTEEVPEAEGGGIAALQGELEAVKDRELRIAAEFGNYRKRTIKEREETWSRAQADLAQRLLEILDDFERVVAIEQGQSTVADVVQGVEMVQRKLLKELDAGGLERVGEAAEKFDPNIHEAIGSIPAESSEEDQTVGVVFQTGYRFGGILLRPAKVQVKMWQGEEE